MTVTMKAVIKHADQRVQEWFLFRIEEKVYRWTNKDGKLFNGVDYVSANIALRGIRVEIEKGVEWIGADLTIIPVEPPPSERAADRVVSYFEEFSGSSIDRGRMQKVIEEETNIAEISDAAQTLLAYIFLHRDAFAMALFPVKDGRRPRDLTMDGLLLNTVEALGKATKQDYTNLLTVLKEPVSNIAVVSNLPKMGGPIQ
jgi:hypothetical protein